MEEDKKSVDGILENMALITDGLQSLFPDGKMICVYELNNDDYKKVQNNFRKIDHQHKRFSIDISGIEHVFIHEDYQIPLPKEEIEIPIPKKTLKEKLSSFFKRS
jgi:spore maturation protein CgeB